MSRRARSAAFALFPWQTEGRPGILPSAGGVGVTGSVRPKVLIVDDEPRLGRSLAIVLGDDVEPVVVDSAESAMEVLTSDPAIEVILCDLMMPGVSGMDLHSWVKDRLPGLAPRMIFMTGGAFTTSSRQFLASTRNKSIDKPFEPAQLLTLIRGVLETRAA